MKVISSDIKDLFIIEPSIYVDQRGFFLESWNQQQFNQAINQEITFVQDNHSHSGKGTLRGLHYQLKHPQGKLVRVVMGNVLDVAVDLRRSSPTFGAHVTVELTAENHRQLWIPVGCAHGFVVLSEYADFLYKTTESYVPEDEYCIQYNDPDLNIDWRIDGIHPILSKKDKNGVLFKSAEYYL
jgi:dTDP-4-dehydrorhamnose 3,5-epimerase